ncbi:3-oxo-tetronate kinase [uncultured Paracoccus sp.]|uniref:3-oxo-tetronate kinase n=1 Tax=uncultured Paracoccus sp. TaxID=189685 RepID=UPI002638F428|nr:3-oxo-tetronate kinase [uncultured Paracoccus sp.]
MTILGCIADDFTGATDLAAMVARTGATVSLRIGLPDAPPDRTADVEVIALKIRSVPAPEAVAAALQALEWLAAAGAQRFYWKYCSTFDSTPAGNIGPVAQALLERRGAVKTLYVPSFPENGRRVFMGQLFVGRQPLAESPMKDHPLNPMRDSDLVRVLAAQVADAVGLIDWPTVSSGIAAVRRAIADGPAHLIADAIRDDDLATLAAAAHDLPLLTGGSALAAHLPKQYRAAGLMRAADRANAPALPGGPALILSGSCSAMTRQQVARYAADAPSLQLDPLTLDRDGVDPALAWLEAQPFDPAPLVYATAAPDQVRAAQAALGVEKAGAVVEAALSRLAVAARARGVTRIVVAGGETAGAVTSALGVSQLRIGPEIAPGVPWCVAEDERGLVALALKSGNFGDTDFFSRALGHSHQ